MSKDTATLVYTGVSHLASLAAVSVLLVTGHLDQTVGVGLLSALVGAGTAAGLVLLNPSPAPQTGPTAPEAPATPAPAVQVPAPVHEVLEVADGDSVPAPPVGVSAMAQPGGGNAPPAA